MLLSLSFSNLVGIKKCMLWKIAEAVLALVSPLCFLSSLFSSCYSFSLFFPLSFCAFIELSVGTKVRA
uniref:Uncharacterized protein n=1 Tax=Rhizophora mucronata TaxID=61149 RepID=A0A2P2NCQ3_RHIMU